MSKIDSFIRDITKVHPMPKSEVRRRLDKILAEERKKDKKQIDKLEGELKRIENYFDNTNTPNNKI